MKCIICGKTIWSRQKSFQIHGHRDACWHRSCSDKIDSDCLRCRHRYSGGYYYGGDCTSGEGEKVKGFESAWMCRKRPNPYNPTTGRLILCGDNIDLDTVQGLIELRKWGNRMGKDYIEKYSGGLGFVGDNCPYFEKKEGLK